MDSAIFLPSQAGVLASSPSNAWEGFNFMSDQKKWFKVWATITTDPHHSNMSLENVGRWTRLGALLVSVGDTGKLEITPPAKSLCALMECGDFNALIEVLKLLPNVQIEEGQSDNGSFTVIMQNWFKYQVDSTGYERVKRSRYKRRGEEIRGEEKRGEDNIAPSPFALRREELKVQDLESFIDRWKKKTTDERNANMAQIMTGIKAFRLGFKMEDEIYNSIMGQRKENPNGTIRSESIFKQAADLRAKEKSSSLRKVASPGEIFAGIRGLPKIQPDSETPK